MISNLLPVFSINDLLDGKGRISSVNVNRYLSDRVQTIVNHFGIEEIPYELIEDGCYDFITFDTGNDGKFHVIVCTIITLSALIIFPKLDRDKVVEIINGDERFVQLSYGTRYTYGLVTEVASIGFKKQKVI